MRCLVYGTLLDPHQALAVVPDATFGPDARFDGLHHVEGQYPTLAPGGAVERRFLRTEQIDTLGAHEGVDDGLYVRMTVPAADGDSVEAYVGDPARLGVTEPVEWPGTGSFAERVDRYVAVNDVCVTRLG